MRCGVEAPKFDGVFYNAGCGFVMGTVVVCLVFCDKSFMAQSEKLHLNGSKLFVFVAL